jgi:hypothetical protein
MEWQVGRAAGAGNVHRVQTPVQTSTGCDGFCHVCLETAMPPIRSDPESLAFRGLRLRSVTEGAPATDLTTCAITASYTELCGNARTAVAPARSSPSDRDGAEAQSESTASL